LTPRQNGSIGKELKLPALVQLDHFRNAIDDRQIKLDVTAGAANRLRGIPRAMRRDKVA
jgi:hypothetical protein